MSSQYSVLLESENVVVVAQALAAMRKELFAQRGMYKYSKEYLIASPIPALVEKALHSPSAVVVDEACRCATPL